MTRRLLWMAPLLVAVLAAAEGAVSVMDLMERITAVHNRLEEDILSDGAAEAWGADAAALDGLYDSLSKAWLPRYGGDADVWRKFCGESRAALAAATAAVTAGDRVGARTSFFRLAEIREKAHADFQPGLWKRISGLFKRKHKETQQ